MELRERPSATAATTTSQPEREAERPRKPTGDPSWLRASRRPAATTPHKPPRGGRAHPPGAGRSSCGAASLRAARAALPPEREGEGLGGRGALVGASEDTDATARRMGGEREARAPRGRPLRRPCGIERPLDGVPTRAPRAPTQRAARSEGSGSVALRHRGDGPREALVRRGRWLPREHEATRGQSRVRSERAALASQRSRWRAR